VGSRAILDRVLAIALVLAAVGISAAAVKLSFVRKDRTQSAVPGVSVSFLASWSDAIQVGVPIAGSEDAPVTVLVLFDLECTVCQAYHEAITEFVDRNTEHVQLVYVHYPLQRHRFALPAARATECAAQSGSIREWLDIVFQKQDSLGLKSWGSYAAEAALKDSLAIHYCAVAPMTYPRIAGGLAFAGAIGALGTPTVIVNGWRYDQTPSMDELERVVAGVLAGENPWSDMAD
jgi:protein-disulfide isomerase